MERPKASGAVFTADQRTNLYYLNDLYGKIARYVSHQLRERYKIDVPITSGIWGGTYLIADSMGQSKRRIWRLNCIVNLPQNSPLDQHENMEKLVTVYHQTMKDAFKPHGLTLELQMWGGRLPHSNKTRPNITIHMEDVNERVRWVRPILVWNESTWEQSVIHDTIRLTKELKSSLNLDQGPVLTDPQEIKYLLQDVVTAYRTLEKAHDADFIQHAEPIIQDMVEQFMAGLTDFEQIRDLYQKVLDSALVYGYEQTLSNHYSPFGLDVASVESWPVEKINWVPDTLQEKLIPPIQELFATFKSNLEQPNT